jgi:hypothetical protein
MKSLWRPFALVALVGLGVLVVAQTPAQAQYRRPVTAPVPSLRPVPPRTLVTTPPPIVPYANSFTYLPSGLNLNQAAALNALRIQTQLYSSLYYPYFAPRYLMNPYLTPGLSYYAPGVAYTPYTPYGVSNPYFAAFGLYP